MDPSTPTTVGGDIEPEIVGGGVGEPTDRPASRHTAGDSDAGAMVHGALRCTRGLGPASGGFPGPGVTRRSLLSH